MKRLVFASLLAVLLGAVGCVGYRSASAPVYSSSHYDGSYSYYDYYDTCYYYGSCYGLYGYPYGYGYGYGYGFYGPGVGFVGSSGGHLPLPGRGHRPPRLALNQQATVSSKSGRVSAAGSHSGSHASSGGTSHSSGGGGGHSGGGGGGGGGHSGGGHR